MRINLKERKSPQDGEWYRSFAYFPVRVNDSHIAWLEPIERMWCTDQIGSVMHFVREIQDNK